MRPSSSARGIIAAGALLSCVVALTGCETASKRDLGTAIGVAAGAIVGHRVDDGAGGVVLGAVLGGVAGRLVGEYMDQQDQARLTATIDQTPSGETVRWRNPRNDRAFEVTPTSDFYVRGDRRCRRFDQVVYVDGRRESMEGVACRAPDDEGFEVEDHAA